MPLIFLYKTAARGELKRFHSVILQNFMRSYNIAIKAYTKMRCKDITCILTNELINFSIMNLQYQVSNSGIPPYFKGNT